jgi:hypothetical protein
VEARMGGWVLAAMAEAPQLVEAAAARLEAGSLAGARPGGGGASAGAGIVAP